MKCKLNRYQGFSWVIESDLSVKGYAYTTEGRYISGNLLLQYLLQVVLMEPDPVSALRKFNGVFSFVYNVNNTVYLYCDKSRFFPLFFRLVPDLEVSDEPESIVQHGDTFNSMAAEEFRCTGYTAGSDTLVTEIKQVAAGELLMIGSNLHVERHRVFSYRVTPVELRQDKDPLNALNTAIEKAAMRFIQSIGQATPVLPLSGGYDSRLIACILKAHGYSNTICFTYGRKTVEVDISQKVAELLGFKWHFVNYEAFDDNRLLTENEIFIRYYTFAAKLTSMFYLQEYPAVLYLLQNSLIPEDSIFLPGHSGDVLGGSQFIKMFPANLRHNRIVDYILRNKYINFPFRGLTLKSFRSRLTTELNIFKEDLPVSIFENWNIQERLAKFIFNSSQVFTFFGYEVRFLFWDDELVEFFRCLPPEYKYYKKLYNKCLQERYFAQYQLNFINELGPGRVALFLQKIKETIKPFLPRTIKYKFILKNDWACYEKLTRNIAEEIESPLRKKLPYNGFNSVLINWYLQKIKKSLE